MLLILGSWLLLALVTTTLGWSAWRALADNRPAVLPLPLEVLSLAGVALLLVGLAPVSLVLPLGSGAVRGGLALLVTALLLGQRRALAAELRRWWAAPHPVAWWAGAGLLGLLLLALLLYQQGRSHNYDEQLYYLQTLHWLERFAVVPGLGNLHGRLAFNSHLFLGTAVFAIPTPTGTYYPLPTYLSVLLAAAAARGVARGIHADKAARTVSAGAALLLFGTYFYVFRSHLPSPAPDCALIIFLSFIFLLYSGFLGPYEVRGAAGRPRLLLLTLLSYVAVTIKLSALPILLLPLHGWWVAHRAAHVPTASGPANRVWPTLLGLGVVVFLPWLIRNLVLSGYPVYPLPGLPGLPVDWRMPPELVLIEQRLVTNIARDVLPAARYGPVETSWQQWLPRWWQYEAHNSPITTVLLVLAAVAPLVALWQAWRSAGLRKLSLSQPGWLSSWLVALAGGLFWFTLAPDYRFGAGFLLVLAFWPWLPLPLPRWLGTLMLTAVVVGTLQLMRDPVYGLRHPRPGAVAGLLWPTLPPLLPSRPVRLPGGQVVRVAVGELGPCGETPLPCTHAIVPGLEFRGNSLAEGFRVRPPAAQR
ncbi:LIC_10190 family membrane protein [Hymenobacter psychrophilus]|uniref:DUF8201 domain-containing protein n=1 Tax=Hymenobacter psychrophilus TaxID=651662 RepID=A0A1H3HP47_9BACT|nr:hypothetical protein [Hymenobacter psychrophilus]SDY16568.1 hypothetical protein SAMN04488069_10657 [Hymenobacter psychrophilus]